MSKELIDRLRGYFDESGMWRKGLAVADIVDAADTIEQQAAEIARVWASNRMLSYELISVLEDVKRSGLSAFDANCLETVERVSAALATPKPQSPAAPNTAQSA
jgi:hypothetical protein